MIDPSIALYGVAKGASASSPTFTHGLVSGEPFSAEATVETDSVSCGVRAASDSYKTEVSIASDIETRAYADVIGLYLLAALGNVTTTASGTNKQHVFDVANTLPELTIWSQIGGGSVRKITGAKVDNLEISFDGNNPLTVGVTLAGLVGTYGSTTWPGSDVSCFDGYFTCVGSTIKLSAGTGTPAAIGNNIVTAGNVSISNNVEAKFGAGSVQPKAIANGKVAISGSLTLNASNEDIQRTIETGTASGTDITGGMVYGSFEWEFVHTKNPDYKLKIACSRVPFTVSAMSVDPEGNALETTLSWDNALIESKDDSPIVVTLINGVATY